MSKSSTFEKVRKMYLENRKIHIEEIMATLNLDKNTAIVYLLWVLAEERR